MGMNLDSGGKGVRPQMNVTPLVDVVLVLLIIFMVIAPVVTKGLYVRLPPKPDDEQTQQMIQDLQNETLTLVARESGLKWEDVTIVEHGRRREDQVRDITCLCREIFNGYQVVFANGSSPSESLMGHSVQVGVSIGGQKVAPRITNSMPPVRRWSFSEVTFQFIVVTLSESISRPSYQDQ